MGESSNLRPMSGRYVRASYVWPDTTATAAQAFPPNAVHGSIALSILLAAQYPNNLRTITN